MYIKNKIKSYRLISNMTQEELAKKLGITRTYLSKLENQKLSPGPKLMSKICTTFSMGLGKLFYVDNNSHNSWKGP